MPTGLAIRIEQMRQARRIHGGTLSMCAAAAAVRLSRVPIPSRWLRERLYRQVYGNKYSRLSEDELERPLGDYRSLNDLFTRGVRAGCRPVTVADNRFLSPCDGTVQDCGRLDRDNLLTVKGTEYSLSSLLPEVDTRHYVNGAFGILFLSPADCHRVFAPQRAVLREIVHVPGSRLLVHPPYQRREFPVLSLNERIILPLETPLGRCVLVMVAGWGVGNITFPYDVQLKTSRRKVTRRRLPEPIALDVGQWLATFELGSTVVMLTEPRPNAELLLERGRSIRFGAPVIKVPPPETEDVDEPWRFETTSTTLIVDPAGRLGGRCPTGFDSRRRVVFVNGAANAASGRDTLSPAESWHDSTLDRLIVFLPTRARSQDERLLKRCVELASEHQSCRVCLVSDYRVHLGDEDAGRIETTWRERFSRSAVQRVSVIRAGEVAEAVAGRTTLLDALHPLVPATWRTCVVDSVELFGVIESLAASSDPARRRVVTLLGKNLPVRTMLQGRLDQSWLTRLLTALAHLLRILLVDRLIGGVVRLADRFRRPRQARWTESLSPSTAAELLELYNPFNHRHVAIAGYNNGATHFGWRFPGRTLLKTVRAGRRIRIRQMTVDVDAGVTLKDLTEALHRAGRALFVLPNFSYVSAGTAFFVPIHGSGRAVSTLGDTIEQALLYDPDADRLRIVRRGDGTFENLMYDRTSGALLLRLTFRTCPRVTFWSTREELRSPTAANIWQVLAESAATNIEIRKATATSDSIVVYRYQAAKEEDGASLDAPRDSIGSLWDRQEENRLAAAAFHGLVRRFGYHVELILSEPEFAVFWNAHRTLPLSKIQMRRMTRDGLPHSPCRDGDCIAVDLFMWRWNRDVFLGFVKQQLPHARFNSGKHSL